MNGEGRYTEMKIDGPGRLEKADNKKKTNKSSSDGSFGDFMNADETQAKSDVGGLSQINQTESLLAVQAAEDPTERSARQRMTKRADKILDMLEEMRMNILFGNVTVGQVMAIADVVASYREKISDPRLVVLLDEIDLRAQIEIAKLSVALERQS